MIQRSTLFFLLATWLIAATALTAQTPVAYYTFSGNAKDQSTFVNHATVNGATLTQDRFGWMEVDFAAFPPGVYVVSVLGEGGVFLGRLVRGM